MTNDFTILYIATAVMVLLSFIIVSFVLWATSQFSKQKKYAEQRDKHWMERIEGVEALVKTEFKEVLNHLKKYNHVGVN